jgi:hypothetical protein
VLDERVGMVDAEGDVEQHFAGGHTPRSATSSPDVLAHLFIAWATKTLLFGPFSDHATDVGDALRGSGKAVDLLEEPPGDPRSEEPHASNRADGCVTRQSRLRAETVS